MTRRIAIVGGGLLGCLAAHRCLDAHPECDVTLVEQSFIASGASRFSAGVHFPIGRSDRVRAMSKRSAAYYEAARWVHPDWPIYPLDFLISAPPVHAAQVRDICINVGPVLARDGIDTGSIELPPEFDVWRMTGCTVAHVEALARALTHELRTRASIIEGVGLRSIEESASGVTLGLSSGSELVVDKAILCPGPWVNQDPFREYTASLGIRTKKIVALHVAGSNNVVVPILFPIDDTFFVPIPFMGYWLFSYTCQKWDVTPDEVLHETLSASLLDEASSWLAKYAPKLRAHVRGGRVFADAYSTEREPVVSVVGSRGHLVFAGAASGAGYRLGPAIAEEAVCLAFGRT